jgi:hypothetical protein
LEGEPLLQFIPKPARFKPLAARFWEREYGIEFDKWEWKLLSEFNQAKMAEFPTISGFVISDYRLGRNRFLLVPAQHLTNDFVICECPPYMDLPSNWSYVTVKGKKIVFRDYYEIFVDEVVPAKFEVPRPEIEFKDFQESLFVQWSGINSPLRELLAFEFVSCPPLFALGQVGGINLSLYDGTGEGLSKRLLKYFKNIIPVDFVKGKPGVIGISELSIQIRVPPFSWGFRSSDVDKQLNENLVSFLRNRKSGRFSELSVGLGTDKSAPVSLHDPPLTLTDQPTILLPSAEKRKINVDPPFEVIKYVITSKMLYPTIGDSQKDLYQALGEAGSRVIKLAEKFDVPHLARRHALFDPNYYGKPQSILRVALALARAESRDKIDLEGVMKAFEKYCLTNMEIIFESWEDFFTSKGVEIGSIKEELDKNILKFISDNETKETGVGLHLIQEHFINRDAFELREALLRLQESGKIYEVKRDVFKSVPLE